MAASATATNSVIESHDRNFLDESAQKLRRQGVKFLVLLSRATMRRRHERRHLHLLLQLASINISLLAVHAAADTFQLVGNGFCVDAQGRRLKLGPNPHLHGQELQWQNAKVDAQGRAKHCEFQCRRIADCIGYMTEDSKACDTILRKVHNAEAGIAGVDRERGTLLGARQGLGDRLWLRGVVRMARWTKNAASA